MSQENVEIIKRGFEHFIATGEVPWDLFDENIEVHDHDTPDQGDYRGHVGYARWLEAGEPPGRTGAWKPSGT